MPITTAFIMVDLEPYVEASPLSVIDEQDFNLGSAAIKGYCYPTKDIRSKIGVIGESQIKVKNSGQRESVQTKTGIPSSELSMRVNQVMSPTEILSYA